jgi:hypothetical protein
MLFPFEHGKWSADFIHGFCMVLNFLPSGCCVSIQMISLAVRGNLISHVDNGFGLGEICQCLTSGYSHSCGAY